MRATTAEKRGMKNLARGNNAPNNELATGKGNQRQSRRAKVTLKPSPSLTLPKPLRSQRHNIKTKPVANASSLVPKRLHFFFGGSIFFTSIVTGDDRTSSSKPSTSAVPVICQFWRRGCASGIAFTVK